MVAALLIALYPDWVPARWPSSDLKSLDLLSGTPINCLWLERPQWSEAFAAEATKRGIATLGVIRREGDAIEAARSLGRSGLTGAVIEGSFDEYSLLILEGTLAKANRFFVESGPRAGVKFDASFPIVSTSQGMWPGIHVEQGGSATAGPTANPWIDTNTGFLRFARASTDATVWIAVRPPPRTVYPVQRYLQAIGDAAANGARWVLDLDDDLWNRLLAHQTKALADWSRIAAALSHFEQHREWRAAMPAGQVAVVEGYAEARLSGGLFDMMAAKHVPVWPAPYGKLDLRAARIAIAPSPETLPDADRRTLKAFADSGQSLIAASPAPPRSPPPEDSFAFDATDPRPDQTWQKVSAALGRRNLGIRLFNVAGMLSNILETRGQRQLILHLVSYNDYPASGITARVPGSWRQARLYRPGEPPAAIALEKSDEGMAFSIDQPVISIATVVIE